MFQQIQLNHFPIFVSSVVLANHKAQNIRILSYGWWSSMNRIQILSRNQVCNSLRAMVLNQLPSQLPCPFYLFSSTWLFGTSYFHQGQPSCHGAHGARFALVDYSELMNSKRSPCWIPDTAYRGMTLQQLHEVLGFMGHQAASLPRGEAEKPCGKPTNQRLLN